jgi:aspartyl-tRNA(Asn)/glutamyl-tRNA(Gln) amidotransferase subunit A
MSGLTRRTASELADALAAGETTSVEITQAHLDRIAEVDQAVHAFLQVDTEGALEAARAADRRRE